MFGAAHSQVRERTVQAGDETVRVQTVTDGLHHPWALAFLPDGRFVVTERNLGTLRVGDAQGRLSAPVDGVPPVFRFVGETGRSQAGLFDVKLHPDYSENGLMYLSYSAPTERGAAVTVVRGSLVEIGGAPQLVGVQRIFQMKPEDQDSSGLHFGGRMALDPSGEALFLSIGERRNISRSQDMDDQAGAIVRFGLDGAPAPDNPFVQDDEADAFVYAGGVRNPQALAVDRAGRLWAVDHGPLGGDSIHRIERGGNHGWPYITTGRDYSGAPLGSGRAHEGMITPAHFFAETKAPSGAVFYDGALFPEWRGDLLVGAMASEELLRIRMRDGAVQSVEAIDLRRRVRDVQVAPDGAVWLVTDHEQGEVLRLSPAGDQRVA